MGQSDELSILEEKYGFETDHRIRCKERASSFHWNNTMELFYVISGEGIFSIGKSTYNVKPGELCIINRFEYHAVSTNNVAEYIYLRFAPQIIFMDHFVNHEKKFLPVDPEAVFFNFINANHFLSKELSTRMQKIVEEVNNKQRGCTLMIKSYITEIYTLLYRHLRVDPTVKERITADEKYVERIKDAVVFINQNYTQKIPLEDISQKVFMEPSYFSAYFKKAMNVSVSNYILSLRIKHAARLLKYSSKKITQICIESGFQSISNFNQAFKKSMGLTPREFRDKYQNRILTNE